MAAIATPPEAGPEATPAPAAPAPGGPPGARPVYVFELPVRLAHWAVFTSILVLTATGFWIGRADLPGTPWGRMDMSLVRAVHVVAGWTLLAGMLIRVTWFFRGNDFASWREWIPSTRKRLGELAGVLKFYTFLRAYYPAPPGGHNVLAGLSYAGIYTVFLFMVCSGVMLEGDGTWSNWHTWVGAPVAWIDLQTLRFLHHLGMYVTWAFVVIHIAIATLIDIETRGNCYSAIFSGYRSRLPGNGDAAEGAKAKEEKAP